ncbi:F-box [Pyrrhoderma noxium]|uniref:F-box n=1 Tax=Pyrrhoderma noxium TaxID=2282107 RepID=A0A286U9E5_9AGAM|nr:F-box [Pyrrhoderma noxium]
MSMVCRSNYHNLVEWLYGIQNPEEDALPEGVMTSKGARKRPSLGNNDSCKRRRLTGKLHPVMNSIPVEIFEEILCNLGADDLLRLSRTCKSIRELLMSKHSVNIWIAAATNLNMPELPPDLNYPQFASFLFDTFCTHCLTARAFKHDFCLRTRLCRHCLNLTVELVGTAVRKIEPGFFSLSTELQETILLSLQTTKVQRIQQTFGSIELDHMRNRKCYTPSAERILKQFYKPELSIEENRALATERHAIVKRINEDASKLSRWIQEFKFHNHWKRQSTRLNRRFEITKRLKDLGYDDDDFRTRNDEKAWKWDTLLNQPRELNDRIWSRILPQLVDTIRLRREKYERASGERKNQIIKWWETTQMTNGLVISIRDLLQLSASISIIRMKEIRTELKCQEKQNILNEANLLSRRRIDGLELKYTSFDLSISDNMPRSRQYLYCDLYQTVQRNYSFEELMNLGDVFRCLRCDTLLQKPMTWDELMQHFLQEVTDWEIRDRYILEISPFVDTSKLKEATKMGTPRADAVKLERNLYEVAGGTHTHETRAYE